MSNLDDIKEEEIKSLTLDDDYDLESLILNGENARIPIQIDYPTPNGTVPVTALLKPLTNVEVQNALAMSRKVRGTTLNIEILKYGLYTKDNEPFPYELLFKMYTGVVDEICKKLMEISGIQADEDSSNEFIEKIMGF